MEKQGTGVYAFRQISSPPAPLPLLACFLYVEVGLSYSQVRLHTKAGP